MKCCSTVLFDALGDECLYHGGDSLQQNDSADLRVFFFVFVHDGKAVEPIALIQGSEKQLVFVGVHLLVLLNFFRSVVKIIFF